MKLQPSRIIVFGAAIFLGLAIFSACTSTPATKLPAPPLANHAEADAYIRSHITELSPEPAVLGGTFYVTSIVWKNTNTATVTYEDGHILLQGLTTARTRDGKIVTTKIRLLPENKPKTSSSSSAGTRPLGKEGAFCGGIAAFPCEAGLTCKLDGTYPDAGGKCVKK